ncbi:type II toxin-antitoxin system RelE/ParE family toxin [Deinococcus roseus]|uniref:Addiction module toxin RelE n=1 Tax=Deinococcus roseus TaxID=392414 RepID=A0ABQ2D2K4_9DEIO|nr:type II toxin-antitoxin system RelE/ParE family toxin [Deinococcus roseus]GGJ43170.1 hypothetical protein GCM10008938_31780 [Deinococcus roseus]
MGIQWTIEHYQSEGSEELSPVQQYILSLLPGERQRFFTRLQKLMEVGLGACPPLSKKLEDNLYELRLENSPNNPRILYCTVIGTTFYLLHGFSKTGNANDKVPESEKVIARKRRQELYDTLLPQNDPRRTHPAKKPKSANSKSTGKGKKK